MNKELIDAWIASRKSENSSFPDPMTELAVATLIPSSSLAKIRAGRVPLDGLRRQRLADKIGVTEAELFPFVKGKKVRAS